MAREKKERDVIICRLDPVLANKFKEINQQNFESTNQAITRLIRDYVRETESKANMERRGY